MDSAVLHLSLPVGDLAEARRFYEVVLGCRVGRVRAEWLDVWFFGMQITLQERPHEVLPPDQQGVRHFGVVLTDRHQFDLLVDRLREHGVPLLEPVAEAPEGALSGKVSTKFADPSANVIEVKYYQNPAAFFAG